MVQGTSRDVAILALLFFGGSNPEEVIFNCDWQKLAAPWSSQAVPHHSTSQALGCLTSEVGRDLVFSTRYGRQRYGCFSPRYGQLKVQAKIVVLLCVHKQRFSQTNFFNRQKPVFNSNRICTDLAVRKTSPPSSSWFGYWALTRATRVQVPVCRSNLFTEGGP